MDYRDNRQRWAESHQVVHFYAGQWCTFTPALTREKGFEIYLKNSRRDGLKLWNTMLEAGKPFGLLPTGSALPRRLEAGIKNFRQDITHDDNPYEVGLGFTVDLEKESD